MVAASLRMIAIDPSFRQQASLEFCQLRAGAIGKLQSRSVNNVAASPDGRNADFANTGRAESLARMRTLLSVPQLSTWCCLFDPDAPRCTDRFEGAAKGLVTGRHMRLRLPQVLSLIFIKPIVAHSIHYRLSKSETHL